MTTKIEFYFTHGHTFTATGVTNISVLPSIEELSYNSITVKDDIVIESKHTLSMHDLRFAVVNHGPDSPEFGTSTIIHGLQSKFDVHPTYEEVQKVSAFESAELNVVASLKRKREKEAQKFVSRRAKRAAARKEQYSK